MQADLSRTSGQSSGEEIVRGTAELIETLAPTPAPHSRRAAVSPRLAALHTDDLQRAEITTPSKNRICERTEACVLHHTGGRKPAAEYCTSGASCRVTEEDQQRVIYTSLSYLELDLCCRVHMTRRSQTAKTRRDTKPIMRGDD